MESIIQDVVTGYLSLMSLIGFVVIGIDKRRAIRKDWRVPERTLFLVAFLGGGIGSLLGMYLFRHKTKHTSFVVLIPIAAVISLVVLLKVRGVL